MRTPVSIVVPRLLMPGVRWAFKLIDCVRLFALAPLARRHQVSLLAVGREHTVEAGEIDARLGH